jgi:hypothetical protein
MKATLSDQELAELGLTGAMPDDMESVSLDEAGVSEAMGAKSALAMMTLAGMLSTSFHGGAFLRVASEAAQRLGFQIECLDVDTKVLRIANAASDAAQLRVDGPGIQGTGWHEDLGDANTVYVDGRVAPRFVVTGPNGSLVVEVATGRMWLRGYPGGLPALAMLDSSVLAWCREAGDTWLASEVESRLARATPWQAGVCVGMCARLLELTPSETRVAAEMIRQGQSHPLIAAPRRWARGLSHDQRSTFERLALAEVDRLFQALEDFEAPDVRDDLDWQAEWREVCHRRDDLEGVRVLLAEAGSVTTLAEELNDLDVLGRKVAFDIPVASVPDDDRLIRSSTVDAGAWWVGIRDEGSLT